MLPHEETNRDYAWEQWVLDVKRQTGCHQLITDDSPIVIAVSGGPDSMLLMHWLSSLKQLTDSPSSLVVAHVHHGFRMEESKQEAALVQQAAERLGLPFEMIQVDSPGYAEEQRMNAQAAARKLRYSFLKDIAKKYNSHTIALAHHADDQAETVLMHMLRGAGSSGLRGISWLREEEGIRYIRPFLQLRKQELVAWCHTHGIPYATDSSNEKRGYLRNRIRLDIMPIMEQENPRLTEALGQLAEMMGAEDDWLQEETEVLFAKHVHAFGIKGMTPSTERSANLTLLKTFTSQYQAGFLIGRDLFLSVHVALQRRLIKLILNYLFLEAGQADFSTIERLRLKIQDNKTTWREVVGNDVIAVREYDHVAWLLKEREGAEPASVHFEIERGSGEMFYSSYPSKIIWNEVAMNQADSVMMTGHLDAVFDADAIQWPMRIRTREHGDRMRVQGLNGSKKVQDMFVDAKIPPSLRDIMPILVDASGQIVWLPGVRRSDIALIGPATRSVVHIRLEPGSLS
ncbi:tRNA lysidine(34) synthetase TilS [Paenibacillus sp. 1001270B_150601_E10]|uniref:tRNA lysidine(34) synthetase TilS n=1 Tax=Paenibacillus sp. 1001270B_150601_E10 TaxID=2787079 RepID=UPI00189DF9A2|nr:tRNA lysidine(34) synthetase TilS [Paenibacillus sp. 1001270B_150601_E10]